MPTSSNKRTSAWAALACCALLAACDDAPEAQGSSSGPAIPRQASKVAGLAPDMVSAVSSGKSATVVSVHFALRAAPTIGKPLPVDIAVVPHVDFRTLRVVFEARDGVKLQGDTSIGPVNDAAAEKAITHHLELMPESEGVYMVTASVDTEGGEGSITRVFSIPVIVAPQAAPAESAANPGSGPAQPATAPPAAPPAS